MAPLMPARMYLRWGDSVRNADAQKSIRWHHPAGTVGQYSKTGSGGAIRNTILVLMKAWTPLC